MFYKSLVLGCGLIMAMATSASEVIAEAGECYAMLYVPPKMVERSEQRELVPANERVQVTPARYEWIEETYTVPAGKRRKVVKPAVVEWQTETVTVSGPARSVTTPAQFQTRIRTEIVATGPQLKRGANLKGQVDGVICVVDGTTTREVRAKVLVRPESQRTVRGPAVVKQVKRKKIIEPAQTVWVDAPARTATRKVKRLVRPASEVRIPVPAQMQTVVWQEQLTPGSMQWRAVLCEQNSTVQNVQMVQTELKRAGFYRGAANGRLDAPTTAAIQRYQSAKGLAVGALSTETVQALGLRLPVSSKPLPADQELDG